MSRPLMKGLNVKPPQTIHRDCECFLPHLGAANLPHWRIRCDYLTAANLAFDALFI